MDRSGAVTGGAIVAFLLVFGIGSFCFAPEIQRAALKMMGEPRNSLAAWSYRLAASKTSLQSIRWTGAMSIALGVVLAFLLTTR